jgi:PRTRC genetic system protein B
MTEKEAAHEIDCFTQSAPFELTEAILIYAQRESGRAYATQHQVDRQQNGEPLIMAGSPLTRQRLRHWTKALAAEPPLELIADNLLARNADAMVWWTPAKIRELYFNLNKELAKGLSALGRKTVRPAACPAHVIAATHDTVYAFALADSSRPGPDTVLLRSPILNIHRSGELCWGTIRRPALSDPDAMQKFESAVFDAWNTHPNDDQATIVEGGLVPLWDELVATKALSFPTDILPPHRTGANDKQTPVTLARLITILSQK